MQQQGGNSDLHFQAGHGGADAEREWYQDALALIERLTCNAEQEQHKILCDILALNSNTEYLRNLMHTISGSAPVPGIDPETFKRVAPLTSYDDVQSFIQFIAEGDRSPILTAHPVTQLLRSSGTASGKRKLFPITESEIKRRMHRIIYVTAVTRKHIMNLEDGKEMVFIYPTPNQWTVGGMVMRSGGTSRWKSLVGLWHLEKVHTSPVEVVLGCEDVSQSTYCQLLCGLICREEVVCVGSSFASVILRVLHVLQQRWRELVEDIRSGCLSKSAVSDRTARRAVEALIQGPNPALAMQVPPPVGGLDGHHAFHKT